MLFKLPLKQPKEKQDQMKNLLGALREETEANAFKPQLIEDSEVTYNKEKLADFEDQFAYTKDGDQSISKGGLRNSYANSS